MYKFLLVFVLIFISIRSFAINVDETIQSTVQNNPKVKIGLEKLIESKELMNFCELPWSKKCLEFYKRKDITSKTASNIQIRQAIYKDSKEKYHTSLQKCVQVI